LNSNFDPTRLAEPIYMIPVEYRKAAVTDWKSLSSEIDKSAVSVGAAKRFFICAQR
jgi:hypothetical protein